MGTFILFMLGIGTFIAGMVWLDYRRLGRHRISDAEAAAFAKAAAANWKVGGEAMAQAQRTERAGRLERMKSIFFRNLKVTLYCVAGIVVFFGGLCVLGLVKGRLDAKDLLGMLEGMAGFSLMFAVLIMGATGIMFFDVMGRRMVLTFIGIYENQPCEIALARDGILYGPGGLQRFTYPLIDAEVLRGTVSVLKIRTARLRYEQDFYVPIPTGLEDEAEKVARFMRSGY